MATKRAAAKLSEGDSAADDTCNADSNKRERLGHPSSMETFGSVLKNDSGASDENDRKKEVKRKRVAKSTEKKKQTNNRLSLLDSGTWHGGNICIIFTPANVTTRNSCIDWYNKVLADQNGLFSAESNRRNNTEVYFPKDGSMKSIFPLHEYHNHQLYDKTLIPNGCKMIKVLTDAEYDKPLRACSDWRVLDENDMYLANIANECLNAVRKNIAFIGAAISIMPKEEKTAWEESLQSKLKCFDGASVLNAFESLSGHLKDPFKYSFRALAIHHQSKDTNLKISMYAHHTDTIGCTVCFLGLRGVSYVFIALPSRNSKKVDEVAFFDKDAGSYKRYYQKYKKDLAPENLRRVELFEKNFLKAAEEIGQPRVRVYRIEPADRLIFAAKYYLHGTIIPAQEDVEHLPPDPCRRCLAIFHDLVPESKSSSFPY